MTNEILVFGSYSNEPTAQAKELEKQIKEATKELLDKIEQVPFMDESIRSAAKKDIVTGMMWAIKGVYAGDSASYAVIKDLKKGDRFKFNSATFAVTRKYINDEIPLIAINETTNQKEKFDWEGLEIIKL